MSLPISAKGEAPGRLDFLGGVADYSGALVLQTPTRCTTRVEVSLLADDVVECHAPGSSSWAGSLTPLRAALTADADFPALRALMDELAAPPWTRYLLGCLIVFAKAKQWLPPAGLSFRVSSDVPQSLGVSSSAALEIATLRALSALTGIAFDGNELAHLGQRAENRIVGAPCGIMDQLASAFGQPGKLLPILCRPDLYGKPVSLPTGVRVVGWPSGVKHAVSGSPYATARTASFMGKRIAERVLGQDFHFTSEIPIAELRGPLQPALPERLAGDLFLRKYGGVGDPLSRVDPEREYPVLAATSFAIEEHARTERVLSLLAGVDQIGHRASLSQIGELMYESHHAYGRMGLGSPQTDRMVEAVAKLGAENGLHGARISGGGSGGTVVLLVDEAALPALMNALSSDAGTLAWIY